MENPCKGISIDLLCNCPPFSFRLSIHLSNFRRTGGNNSAATSRLFMNAVKDASKGVRNPGERTGE